MNLFARLLLPLAAVSTFAAPALAQSYRIPTDSVPAIEVTKQAGWSENYDDSGNLTFFAQDGAGGLLFRLITGGPNEAIPENGQIASIILAAAGAKPFTSRGPTTLAGGPAEAFNATMAVDNGPTFDLVVVIRNLDARHLAVGVKMIPQTTGAEGRKKIDAQFAQVKIVTN